MFDIKLISQAIFDGEAERVLELTEQALNEGFSAEVILEKGLIQGMNKVAEKFRVEKVSVPEVLLSTRAMHAGLDTIQPLLKKAKKQNRGKVVIGTVEGDLHDIGKSIVSLVLITLGLKVIDLGVNVSVKQFVQAVRKEKPDILMMSALLTTTLPAMIRVIDELKEKDIRNKVIVMVGGTPVTASFAKEIGADYYFGDIFEMMRYFEANLSKII